MKKCISYLTRLGLITALATICLFIQGSTAQADPIELVANRTQTSKLFSLGANKYGLDLSITSLHYKEDPTNAAEQWKDIDTTIVASSQPGWNWQVVKGNWHLLVKTDTSVAVGKGGNWLGFKYAGFGWLDWGTKEYVVLQTRQAVAPAIQDNRITWDDIFYGCSLEYAYTPDGFKENLYINQTARNWLAAHPPSAYGLNNSRSYLVGAIECDWQGSFPATTVNGTPINWNNVNEFIDSGVLWQNPVTQQIASALPIGFATHPGLDPEQWAPVRYRFYAQDGKHYLLLGVAAGALNAYPAGTITLDPTLDLQVGASNCDSWELEAVGSQNPTTTYIDHVSSTSSSNRKWGAHRWASASLPTTGCTITSAYIQLNVISSSKDDINGFVTFEEGSVTPDVFGTDSYNISDRDRTESYTDWIKDSCGTGWEQSDSLVSPLQEVIDGCSPTALVVIIVPYSDTGKSFQTYSYDGTPAWAGKLHIEWTAPSAGKAYSFGYILGA